MPFRPTTQETSFRAVETPEGTAAEVAEKTEISTDAAPKDESFLVGVGKSILRPFVKFGVTGMQAGRGVKALATGDLQAAQRATEPVEVHERKSDR